MAKNIIDAAINQKIRYFLNISSINLYKPKKKKIFEKDLSAKKNISNDPESLSKLIFIKQFKKIPKKFFYLNLILSNVYGFKERNNSNLLLDKIFKNIFLKKKYIIYFSKKNKNKINYLYIDDAVNAIDFFLKKLIKNRLRHNSINVCSGNNYALSFIINKIKKITKTKIEFNNHNNNNLSILPSGLVAKKYGWRSKTSIDEGIKKTINYYKRIKKNF
jgi:nucleoside-diphosphate-sugar epimerase